MNKKEEKPTGLAALMAAAEKQNKRIESGEVSCNLDNPEDCEACGA